VSQSERLPSEQVQEEQLLEITKYFASGLSAISLPRDLRPL